MQFLRFASSSLALALTLTACLPNEVDPVPVLPEATRTGANTAGARVDGKVWVPSSVLFAPPSTKVSVFRAGGHQQVNIYLSHITDTRSDPFYDTSIDLLLPDVVRPDTIGLNQDCDPARPGPDPAYAQFRYSSPSPVRQLTTSSRLTGQVIITRFDSVARVISGTFDFKAQDKSGTSRVDVQDGRFDLKY